MEPLLNHGSSHWISSSQHAADLYDQGVKLWRKEDLINIEHQLTQSHTAEKFTIRRIDGSLIHIKNPIFGVQKPIWTPCVKFQEFWSLVRAKPEGPHEMYLCSYLVDWTNQTVRNYEGPIENARSLLETSRGRWVASMTCDAFISRFGTLLSEAGHTKKVNKIVCFGLGDINFKPPDWWRTENDSRPENEREPETSVIDDALTHHAVALTMADIARSFTKPVDAGVRLLTQDPCYSDETKDILREIGFEIIGDYGAGGFGELDDDAIVFSAFASAPIKQIMADLARPLAIICPRGTAAGVFSHMKKPYADPESPRTRRMWDAYQRYDFPVQGKHVQLGGSLQNLAIYIRK